MLFLLFLLDYFFFASFAFSHFYFFGRCFSFISFASSLLRFFRSYGSFLSRPNRPLCLISDSSFVFSVRCLGNGLVASGDDAGNLSALRLQDATPESPQQSATLVFKHPTTLWSLAALPGKESEAQL